MEKLTLHKFMDYTSELNLLEGQITHDGTLILIETDQEELDFFERPVKKYNWTIRIVKEPSIENVELKNVPLIPTHIDLFSDGTLLIVQSRCLKDGSYTERNARIYNPNGQLIDAFTLGDGIAHVQIDELDTIWVSYFDEGIFGNFGWDDYTIGSDGFIAFNKNGKKLWGAGKYGIIDCYAMNVKSSNEVYFYYDGAYRIVHLSNMKEVNSFYVKGSPYLHNFLFAGDGLIVQKDAATLTSYKRQGLSFKEIDNLQCVDEKGCRINKRHIFMRGSRLYIYAKDGIYKREFSKEW